MKEVKDQPRDGTQALSIRDLLEIQAQRKPDAIAIRGVNRPALTFRRLLLQAQDAVKSLNALGIGRNSRVAVILPNGPELAAVFLAVSSGAAFAPLNPAHRANEFDFYLSDLQAKALIVQAGIDSPARAVARQRSIPIIELSLATQIISRLRDGFSLDFPLRALFEDPTVAGLAARIAVLQAKRSHPEQLAEVLTSLESCSDEEAELLLSQENSNAI